MDNKRLPCPPPPPKGQIAPRVGMVARLERINFNRAVAEEGLFSGQHKIIMFLKLQGSATIGEIAKETGTKPSTISVSVKRMEKAGFVKRRQSKADGRITEILLTAKGQAVPENIHHKMEAEEKMQEIRIVNRAKWLLITELKMTETDAHRYIEKQAMDRCVSKKEIAEEIINTYSYILLLKCYSF